MTKTQARVYPRGRRVKSEVAVSPGYHGLAEAINQHKRCMLRYVQAVATPRSLLMDFAKTGNYNQDLIYWRKPLILCQFLANWRSVILRQINVSPNRIPAHLLVRINLYICMYILKLGDWNKCFCCWRK